MAESSAGLAELAEAVDQLPPKLRSIVILKDVYGLSHEDIAEELGISVAAAKVRLHRGRKKLRDVLYEEGGRSAYAV
jgi:RNA polymerase sigma-70 factor (ECF subfamily)